uniref:Uncharacterized protein n=1 Tax=Accipiter nisus TaxID=211598 RepID=A0A8B9MNH8_9AVES
MGDPASMGISVSSQVEPPQGVMEDEMALNRIWLRLALSPPPAPPGLSTDHLLSSPSSWGHWLKARWLLSNEVATTSACFACCDGHILEGPGSAWGQWGGWSPWCPRAVCGIQTQQDPAWGLKRDDTALNDLCLFCP